MKLNFNDSIQSIFKEAVGLPVNRIEACGNHDLNRNMVFIVETNEKKWIIKFFYKPDKRHREIKTLELYKGCRLKILYKGETLEGYEWLIYNFIEGVLLEDLLPRLSMNQKKAIFKGIGEEMQRFHKVAKFDHFGDWCSERQTSIRGYKAFIINDSERIIKNIYDQELPGMDTIALSIDVLRQEYANVSGIAKATLCHRDLDGRNILIRENSNGDLELASFLDFEKCVVYNPVFDIIGLYRKYFISTPDLISAFFEGYQNDDFSKVSFNAALRFYLFRNGLDICSWTYPYSKPYYYEGLNFLKALEKYDAERSFNQLILK